MRGDQEDCVRRLRLTLPEGWFADEGPVLRGLLRGLGWAWSWSYGLLEAVRRQSRLATATEQFLDLACGDFFGARLARRGGEGDAGLRARLLRAMLRQSGTRAGLIAAAQEVGYAAAVFEPARPADTGCYGAMPGGAGSPASGGLAWGVAGGWGSLAMPLECFVGVRAEAPTDDPGRAMAEAMPAGGAAWVRQAQ